MAMGASELTDAGNCVVVSGAFEVVVLVGAAHATELRAENFITVASHHDFRILYLTSEIASTGALARV